MLDLLIEGVSAPSFVVDPATLRLRSANTRMSDLLGISFPELAGASCTVVCAGQDSSCPGVAPGPLEAQFHAGAGWVRVLLRGEGELREARLIAMQSGGQLALMATLERGSGCSSTVRAVQISALGLFEIRSETGGSIEVRRPQALMLLKLLLMRRGHSVTDTELMGALWPDGAPEGARDSLRVLVHDLRHALEPLLPRGNASRFVARRTRGYLVREDAPLRTDIDAFEDAVSVGLRAGAAGDVDEASLQLDEALRLYRGPLFEGDAGVSWFSGQRERFHRLWVSTLTARSALHAAAGDPVAALRLAQRATTSEPSHEQAQRLLLLLIARQQGRTAALERFVELSGEFRHRFGVAPSRETAELAGKLSGGTDLAELEREYWPLALTAVPALTSSQYH